jgi:MFS family permease
MAFVLARQGASSFEIGAATSIGTVAVILLGTSYPRAIARLGLRYSIVSGTAIAIAVLLVMPLQTGFQAWLILRFVAGCALGLAWIASEVWLNTLATDRSRSTVMGIYSTVFAAGVMSGPLLLQFTGTAGAGPFHVGALFLVCTALPLFFANRAPSRASLEPRQKLRLIRTLKVAPVAMVAALLAGLVESTDLSLLPVLGLRRGLDEDSSLHLVTVFLAGNVLLQLPISMLADRFGRLRILAACALVSSIGPLLLGLLIGVPSLLWPLLILWGGTMYGFYTQGIALLGDSYPPEELAAANAVFVVVYCAGGIMGPSLGGLSMDLWNPNGLIAFLSCAPLLVLVPLLARVNATAASAAEHPTRDANRPGN